MRRLVPQPLTPAAFALYGEVLEAPDGFGRTYFDARLANGRSGATPSLSMARIAAVAGLPITAVQMERHEFSSQSFIPLEPARWLVIVAPTAADGGPDTARAQAFLPGPGQGITYGMNVWHHPMTVIGAPARFAIVMWLERSKTDEEFVQLAEPFEVG